MIESEDDAETEHGVCDPTSDGNAMPNVAGAIAGILPDHKFQIINGESHHESHGHERDQEDHAAMCIHQIGKFPDVRLRGETGVG